MQPNDSAAPATALAMTTGYEFTQRENVTIQRAGKLARIWGILSIAVGILMLGGTGALLLFSTGIMRALAAAVPQQAGMMMAIGVGLAPVAIVNLLCGGFYIKAGGALAEVVNTQGNDVTHMLRSLDSLRFAFQVEAVACVVATVAGFAIGVASQFVGYGH